MSRAVVTGANRGIGLELARQLVARGDTVAATCRASSAELNALDVDVFENVDVGDQQSVADFAHRLGDEPIDMLINNAGILTSEELDSLDRDRLRRQFEVNTLGPLRVISALIPCMAEFGKIGILTSRVGSMADNSSGGMYGYRISKVGANMFGVNLAHDLKAEGSRSFCCIPATLGPG